MYIDEETKAQVRKESRIFQGIDWIWAAMIATLLAWLIVKAMIYFGYFENHGIIHGNLGDYDFRGLAILLWRVGIFIVSGAVTLMVRVKTREKN